MKGKTSGSHHSPSAERGLKCYMSLNVVDCLALLDSSTIAGVSQSVMDVGKL